jgi:excisionase family DNA binding protein
MTERLMTARQVGDVLGFSAETILRWYRAGKLPGVKTPGGALRFHPAAIEATIASWSTATPDASAPSPVVLARGEA